PAEGGSAAFRADGVRRAGKNVGAARALAACAGATEDGDLAAALHIEAAMLLWRGDDKRRAIQELDAARAGVAKAGATLLNWALRGADPSSLDGRRRAIEIAADAGTDASFIALERFGLEAAIGDADEA